MRLGTDITKPQFVLTIKAMAKGLLAAVLIFSWIGMIDDLIRTFASDLTDNTDLQWALRSTVVWFTIAFIGTFVARERLHVAAIVFVMIYWANVSTSGYLSKTSWGSELPYMQFMALWMTTVIPSVAFCWLGAVLCWRAIRLFQILEITGCRAGATDWAWADYLRVDDWVIRCCLRID